MKSIQALALATAILVIGTGWYLFRPELLLIDSRVSEQLPQSGTAESDRKPVVLASGQFRSVAHPTTGAAAIYQLAANSRLLRLSDFSTSNGPAVYVYLVALPDADDSASVSAAETVSLGPLKGNVGDQNYEIPPGVDLSKFRSVTIWCQRFGVNFGTAPLATRSDGSVNR